MLTVDLGVQECSLGISRVLQATLSSPVITWPSCDPAFSPSAQTDPSTPLYFPSVRQFLSFSSGRWLSVTVTLTSVFFFFFPVFKDHCPLFPEIQCLQILCSLISMMYSLFHTGGGEGRFNSCYYSLTGSILFIYLFLYDRLDATFHLTSVTAAAKHRSKRRTLKCIKLRGFPGLEETQAKQVPWFASSIYNRLNKLRWIVRQQNHGEYTPGNTLFCK